MKKLFFLVSSAFIFLTTISANPAAINLKKIKNDKTLVELTDNFLNVYGSISNPNHMHKEEKSNEIKIATDLIEYLNDKKRKKYEEELIQLLAMRCLYNFDKVEASSIDELYLQINEKYSKKAEHHWIYGNYLTSAGKTIDGKNKFIKFLNLNNHLTNKYFLNDFAYSQFLCGTPIKAYYTLTNGGKIPEDKVENKFLLNSIKEIIIDSSWSEPYELNQVWKISDKQDDGYNYIYSTMLGISFPVKSHWNLKFMPINPKSPVNVNIGIRDFTLNDLPLGISMVLLLYPESIYSDEIDQSLKSVMNIIKTENIKIKNVEFEKNTFEDLSRYNDERKGSKGYFYKAKIIPNKLSGVNCEHDINLSEYMNNSKEDSQVRFIRLPTAQKRLEEPIIVYMLVDSCNVIETETQELVDSLFEKAIFE